jgi:hypothetical protein
LFLSYDVVVFGDDDGVVFGTVDDDVVVFGTVDDDDIDGEDEKIVSSLFFLNNNKLKSVWQIFVFFF